MGIIRQILPEIADQHVGLGGGGQGEGAGEREQRRGGQRPAKRVQHPGPQHAPHRTAPRTGTSRRAKPGGETGS